MGQHECLDVLSKIFLALDGEMSPEEEKAFLKEINECSCCLEKFQVEQAFKAFLASKVERKEVKAGLVDDIRNKIKVTTA